MMEMRHAGKRFALFTPPPEDPDFARVRDHLIDTVSRAALRLRAQCAMAHGISIFETEALIVPDPDRPNFITVTTRPLAIVDPFVEPGP